MSSVEKLPKIAPLEHNIGAYAPAGELSSSVLDICKFISLQFYEGTNDDIKENDQALKSSIQNQQKQQQQILTTNSIREMHLIQSLNSDWTQGYGLGWQVEKIAGHTIIGHGGGNHGFTTGIAAVPDLRLGIGVFTNYGRWMEGIVHYALELLIPIVSKMQLSLQRQNLYKTKAQLSSPPPSSSSLPTAQKGEEDANWQKYAGWYTHTIGSSDIDFEIEIRIENKILIISHPGEEAPPGEVETEILIPETEQQRHKFRTYGGPYDGECIIFQLDDNEDNNSNNNKATSLKIGGCLSLKRKGYL
jgi:beta-lactamase family protein